MNFSASRKIDICICAAVAAIVGGCEPQNVREEKSLSRQLVREMRGNIERGAAGVPARG